MAELFLLVKLKFTHIPLNLLVLPLEGDCGHVNSIIGTLGFQSDELCIKWCCMSNDKMADLFIIMWALSVKSFMLLFMLVGAVGGSATVQRAHVAMVK